ncbi:MAG: Fic family protein, partial [Alphaproteobacteria bacterium]|nr:Fic family protein [Alphaproteobacteria bacterium]
LRQPLQRVPRRRQPRQPLVRVEETSLSRHPRLRPSPEVRESTRDPQRQRFFEVSNWIHPFDDGNGRTARALCHFVMCVRMGA